MKTLRLMVLMAAFGFLTINGFAQNSVEASDFTKVERMPMFPGGTDALVKYVSASLQYPEAAKRDSLSGNVIVAFMVLESGKIGEAKIMRGFDASCDAEALRVVKAMPNWQPGLQQGKAVNVWMNLPIAFKLQ